MKKNNLPLSSKKQSAKTSDELLRESLMSSADKRLEGDLNPVIDIDEKIDRELVLQYFKHNPIRRYVSASLRPYMKKFPLEFYELVYKLHGWSTEGKKLFTRPSVVGTYTNNIIYHRFPPGTLKEIQVRNPYIRKGVRLHKHFQLLTPEGELELLKFIDEAIVLMKKCTRWSEFMSLLAKEYGHPYQIDLFDSSNQ